MINISETAASKVRELLDSEGKSDYALRIFVRGMSCSGPAYGMALDNEPTAEDTVETFGGLRIVVDPVSAQYVDGAEVDYVDSLMGRGFTVKNEAYQSEGGCGSGGCSCGHGGGH